MKHPGQWKVVSYLQRMDTVLWVYVLVAVAATLHKFALGTVTYYGFEFERMHNFTTFKQSFFHLIDGKDLYIMHTGEQQDLYKYSPTFALFMAPFAVVPHYLGVVLWNVMNAVVLYGAIRQIGGLRDRTKVLILWFCLVELLTSIQNAQSNGLTAALIIAAFNFREQGKDFPAAFLLMFSVYVKLFGVVAYALMLLYRTRGRFLIYSLLSCLILFAVPLVVVSFDQLLFLYQSWAKLLLEDHASKSGLSVMTWLESWFGVSAPKMAVVGMGAVLYLAAYSRLSLYRDYSFRLLLLASTLIWVIIFNHMAESPMYVIAMTGVALWYFPQTRKTENVVLLVVAYVFVSLSPTSLFPGALRKHLVKPYVLNAVPCIVIWLKIQYELLFAKYQTREDRVSFSDHFRFGR